MDALQVRAPAVAVHLIDVNAALMIVSASMSPEKRIPSKWSEDE